jgi:hypothetical protein
MVRPVRERKRGCHPLGEVGIERAGDTHHGDHALSLRRREVDELVDGLLDTATVQVAERETDDLRSGVGGAPSEQVGDDPDLGGGGDRRVGQRRLQSGRAGHRPTDAKDLVLGRLEGAVVRSSEECRLVAEDAGAGYEVVGVGPAHADRRLQNLRQRGR